MLEKIEENYRLKNHNQNLQLKLSRNDEENSSLKRVYQELLEHIKKLRDDEKSQKEKFKKIQYDNNLLENKLDQILKEASRLSIKKQTIKTPYRHPNYKNHLDQRHGQNEHKQRSYDFIKEKRKNQQTKQKMRSSIKQSD